MITNTLTTVKHKDMFLVLQVVSTTFVSEWSFTLPLPRMSLMRPPGQLGFLPTLPPWRVFLMGRANHFRRATIYTEWGSNSFLALCTQLHYT